MPAPLPKPVLVSTQSANVIQAKKIPDLEISFVKDQREKAGMFGGKQFMGNVGKKEAKLAQKECSNAEKKQQEALAVDENITFYPRPSG